MSVSSNKGEVKLSQTEITVTKTEVPGKKRDLDDELIADIGKVSKTALKSLSGFRTFILRGNVVDLATGIVIGAAFTSVVTSLVGDVITPLIPLPGKNSLGGLTIPLPSFYPKNSTIHIGLFINAVISFLIVAAVLYFFVVQPVNSLMKLYKPKETENHDTQECPYCFQMVNAKATRCPFCTSRIKNNGEYHEHEDEKNPVLVLPASLETLSEQLAEKLIRKTGALERATEEGEVAVEKG